MEKERRTKALVIVVLLIVIAGLTIAFASLSATLNINGTAYLNAAKWGIKFKNLSEPVKIGSANVTGTAKIEDAKSAEITGINVSLSTPGDKVTYTVDLVNEGTINAKIDNIEKTVLTEEQQKYLTFKVTDNKGNEVTENDILQAGETKNLTITIEFIKDLTKEDLPTNASTISLSYKLNFVQTDEKKDTTSNEVQNELPSGYKRVEYLESTGTQYINLEKSEKNLINDDAVLHIKFSMQNTTKSSRLFGAATSNSWCQLFYNVPVFGAQYHVNYNYVRLVDTNIHSFTMDVPDKKWNLDANEKELYFPLWNLSLNAYLFARNNNGVADMYSYARIYDFNIYHNELIMNLIPCLDSDNKPCMYDTVSKKTFYNSGTGEFLYGNVID